MNRTIVSFSTAALVLLSIIWSSWYTIDQGERGVVLRNGAIVSVSEPGLHFKIPLIDSVKKISIQTFKGTFEKLAMYSKDQQTAFVQLSINYRIQPGAVDKVYTQYGGREGVFDRVISPKVFEKTKNVFGQFNAVNAIQDRARLNTEMQLAVQNAVTASGAFVEAVQVENVDFSDEYEKSIEARMQAEVEVAKLTQQLEQDKVRAEQARVTAAGQADAVRTNARAKADAVQMQGEAEAMAIRAKGDALRANPELVSLIAAERWNGALPTTMIPGGSVPFLSVGK